MIKWCAYCQQFIEEIEPFGDYTISHGICLPCLPKLTTLGPSEKARLAELQAFFKAMGKVALSGAPMDLTKVLEENDRLGIRHMDLMMGMLQPLLAQIGDLWASGAITVEIEHRFSALVGDLLAHFRSTSMGNLGSAPPPDLVLVNAADNYHTLGLQMADAYLTGCGIPTLSVVPGLPTREVLDILGRHKPRAVGFSVALPNQMAQVRELAGLMEELPDPPQCILVGGPAVRLGLNLDPPHGIQVCRNLVDVPAILNNVRTDMPS